MTRPAPNVDEPIWFPVGDVAIAGGVRRAATTLANDASLSDRTIGNLAIVVTEMATNLARHAVDGVIVLRVRRAGDRIGVEIVAIDAGPGVADITTSTVDGVSTAGTLGIGLGAIARMADELDMYSLPGAGTVVSATLWDGTRPPDAWVAGISRPIVGEDVCGDGFAARDVAGRRQVMLCDGLGHGPIAAVASRAVISEFAAAPAASPRETLEFIHGRTRHTRGSVAAVAELDTAAGVVKYAGIGNVSGSVVHAGERRAMVSLPGIVGHQHGGIREFTYPMSTGGLVVLHSDGLTDRWDLTRYPGLIAHAPVLVAATLLRDAGRRRDDASVLVARA
jgi:anti-sigma regulatory factor (Ser/Thr protein kinase)